MHIFKKVKGTPLMILKMSKSIIQKWHLKSRTINIHQIVNLLLFFLSREIFISLGKYLLAFLKKYLSMVKKLVWNLNSLLLVNIVVDNGEEYFYLLLRPRWFHYVHKKYISNQSFYPEKIPSAECWLILN